MARAAAGVNVGCARGRAWGGVLEDTGGGRGGGGEREKDGERGDKLERSLKYHGK